MNHSEETKAKIRAAWVKRREGFVPPMKGKKMSEASRQKMSKAAKARPSNRTGKHHTAETKRKISEITKERTPRGRNHYAYSHGNSQRDREDRRTDKYKHWRLAVFDRDEYTCRSCGNTDGGNLQAHHIKPYAAFPDARFAVDNGITLCRDCHEQLHMKPIPTQADIRRRRKHTTQRAVSPGNSSLLAHVSAPATQEQIPSALNTPPQHDAESTP